MNRYFVAGYYVEHEDMGYEIEVYKENKDMYHPHELEYEVNRELVDLLNGEFKECVCVKVYIRHDDPVIPDDLIPRRIKFTLGENLLQVFYLNLEKINNMYGMFEDCVNFLGFNWWPAAGEPFAVTGEVTDTSHMFANCRNIVSIDMSRLNTNYVERMIWMFKDCESLKGLCISQYIDNVSTQLCEWDTSNVKSMYGMFEGCRSVESLPVDVFNMFSVENTDYMFKNCESLKRIEFKDHNELISKEYYPYQFLVTTNEMFYNCSGLEKLNIPYFYMSKVEAYEYKDSLLGRTEFRTGMRDMFYNCHSLYGITLENFEIGAYRAYYNELTFKTFFELLRNGAPNLKYIQIPRLNSRLGGNSVTDISSLFENLTELTEADLNGWNTKGVTDMSHMFHGCAKLESINIDGWDLSNVRYAYSMFEDCNSLPYIMLEDKPFKKIAAANGMFKNCQSLNSIEFNDQSMFEFLAVANEMFYGCTGLKNLTIPNFDVRRIGAEKTGSSVLTDMDNIFYDCGNLETLKLDKFKIDNATSVDTDVPIKTSAGDYRFEYFFDALRNGAPNIKTIEMRNFNNYDNPHYNSPSMTSMKNMFKDFTKVETIDLSDCNTWGITDMSYMFANCNKLTSLDLSSFRTNDVTTMEGMFRQTSSLKQLNISNFDFGSTKSLKYFLYNSGIEVLPMYNFGSTGNVTDMSFMFCHCGNLRSLENMENLNTKNVTNMSSMFWGCSKIEELQLSNFNTDQVTNMSSMFRQCKMLSELDLSAFNTSNVKTYQSMFEGCESIQKLDLSHFRGMDYPFMTDKCFGSMFKDCKNLEILDIGGFTGKIKSSKDVEYMFDGCEKLRYIDMSNFRNANDNLYNGVSVFRKVALNSSSKVLNIGMLYIQDVGTCVTYAKKLNDEVVKNINRINIYVEDVNADECMVKFDGDSRIRFIKYTNEVKRIDLPMSIPGKNTLRWDANLREYYNDDGPVGVHEKIKIPTCATSMYLDFNPWCERDEDGNLHGEKDVEHVKVQIPMKEKIEEESDK